MSELEFWKDLGNIFDAVMNYQRKNVEFNNRFINPWIRLGNIFEKQDQANDAVQAYKHATEIDPDTPQNWVELGDAQFKKGDFDQAIEAYSKAVALDPEAGWPLGNLALSLVTQGRVDEAIPLYRKSIDLLTEVKDKAICWNRLGNAYRKLNDYENAFLSFQKADQLDGENTGFSDRLDEALPSTSVVAPEEILEQMVVNQSAEESEAVLTAPEPTEETAQPEVVAVEPEPAVAESPVLEVVDQPEPLALGPNMEMKVEDNLDQEEIAPVQDETAIEQSPIAEAEEETPLTLHDRKFNLIEIVENVIAKVERAYAEQKSSQAGEEPEAQEVPAAAEEIVQEVETAAVTNEEAAPQVEAVSEEVGKEAAQDMVPTVAEAVAPEVEALVEEKEEAVPEVETPVMTEAAPVETVAAPAVSEETPVEVESIETAPVVEAQIESPAEETPNVEEQGSTTVPQQIPDWLVMKASLTVKVADKKEEVKAEAQLELAQVETVATLSDISQEGTVSESEVNMDVVETYTDQLTATPEPVLSEETAQTEAVAQPESRVEADALQAPVIDASTPEAQAVVAEELPKDGAETAPEVAAVEQTTEPAYEEYLKDAVEPVQQMKDHVDDIQGEAPLTKISRNGEVRIAMDTKNAHVWNELGNIYLNAGTYEDAIASYSKAIELDRGFAWPYSNLALAYVQKGRFAEAILLYQRGIELFTSDRDKAITWNRLGNVYRRINDYSNAISSYQTADELDPENTTLSLRSSFGLLGNMYSDAKPAYVA